MNCRATILRLCLWGFIVGGGSFLVAEPKMLMREIHSETVLVERGKPLAVIVAPLEGTWHNSGEKLREGIAEIAGSKLKLLSPKEVCSKDGLTLRKKFKETAIVFVGNIRSNRALFQPYLRRWFVVDEETPGGWTVHTFPNPWGTGIGYALVGGSSEKDAEEALQNFLYLCKKHQKNRTTALPRVFLPAPDELVRRAGRWRRLARPTNEDFIRKFKSSKRMHLGYHIGRLLHEFTLITELGAFSSEELNDIENEVLENMLMIHEKVWWYRRGGGEIGGRHPLFKNARLYLAVEHLLTVGRPNPDAKVRLGKMAREIHSYFDYVLRKAYRCADLDPCTEADQAWFSAMWFALLTGEWEYFKSGRAFQSALFGLLETDNLGAQAGHFRCGFVRDPYARSEVSNALRLAEWWYKDGRFKWLLENLPFSDRYGYGFPIRLPLDGIEARLPLEWLGVQWLPISEHLYQSSIKETRWEQPAIPRERTFELLTFRSGFGRGDQYLAIDGFQNQFQPLGLGSVLRYTDLGKLFLVAHTGKEGNYYKSGATISTGIALADETNKPDEPWGAELLHSADFPEVALVGFAVPRYHRSEWRRYIVWRKRRYFIFIDEVRDVGETQAVMTLTWRTALPTELRGTQ